MLGSTIALTIGGSAKTLTLINQDGYGSEYFLREATQEFRMKVRHSNASDPNKVVQDRHNVEIVRRVFATSTTPEYNDKLYFVMQALAGRTTVDLAAAVFAWGTATSNAKLTQLENWES